MDKLEREQAIKELQERLHYFSDERLRLLLKSSQPITPEDLKNDIEKYSKNLR